MKWSDRRKNDMPISIAYTDGKTPYKKKLKKIVHLNKAAEKARQAELVTFKTEYTLIKRPT